MPLGRPSPAQAALEKTHAERALSIGHLRRPTAAQRSGRATRTHVVGKKDDPEGRWVRDFRALNRVMRKRPIPIAHTHDQVRQLASYLWKSLFDVEKSLAHFGLIRQHLTSRFSHLAEPLRDVLTALHERRAQAGRKRPSALAPASSDPQGRPSFWSCKDAFQEWKRLAS